MRLLELHCDYISVKPRQKALKGIAELNEEEKQGLRMENVLVVFSSFEEGDSEELLVKAAAEVEKNFKEVKASAVLVYPYAHLSPHLAKPSVAATLLDKFVEKVKAFAPRSRKTPFGYYKEFELKCKGHPLAELSKTIQAEEKVKALGAKDVELFPAAALFADYGRATAKTLAQNNSLEAQRNTALLLTVVAAEEMLGATPTVAFGKDNEAYVDLLQSKPLNPDVLEALQKQARVLAQKALTITVKKTPKSKAALYNAFQKEAAQEVESDGLLVATIAGKDYWLPGPFCKNTKEVKAFLLTKFGGSYWRNNAKNQALQRVHVLAFGSQMEMDAYLALQREAEKRDHRLIGKHLELFSFHEEGTGFPFYHPNGVVVRNELIAFLREEYQKRDYQETITPLILNEELWRRSGHWDHYKESMYFTNIEGVPHAVKPMNCPGSILVYKNRPRSYRELPLRLAEFGVDHRHELSGVLSGLFRVRSFTQDDAHIFCMHKQVLEEVSSMLEFAHRVYSTFGFDYCIELSTKPEKAMGDPELWEKAEEALKQALEKNKKPFEVHEGEGAFYGPKIDFKIKDALGREWQCGTIQLDFQMPENFDLHYEGDDGKRHRPAMIHRAIYGSLERFTGVLIEHFAGAFPVWLSPTQAIVLPLTDNENTYAQQICYSLKTQGFRVKADLRSAKIEGKIRDSQLQKIPYMLVVGVKERESKTVSVRRRDGSVKHNVKLETFTKDLLQEIKERTAYA